MSAVSTSFTHELGLATDYGDIAHARRFTAEVLTLHGSAVPHDFAVLLVSELVANALRHGRGGGWLRLSGTDTQLRVEVRDHLPGPAEMTPGFGLILVDRLSERWGVTVLDDGKIVWCELAADSDPDERVKLQYGHRADRIAEVAGR